MGVPAFPASGAEHPESADDDFSVQQIPALALVITMTGAADIPTIGADFQIEIGACRFSVIDTDNIESGIKDRLEMY